MTANVTINPYETTVGNNGLFNTTSVGLRQGTAYPDPSTVFARRTGILAAAETLPMWGGVGIYENVPGPSGPTNPSLTLGVQVGRATALTGTYALAGFSVFDGAYGMITSPQSTVPLIGTSGQVLSFALGSRARIAVQCDPALVDLEGGPIGANVSWDFTNQLLVPYLGSQTISSGTYVSATGVITLVMAATQTFDAGDSVTLAALTGTGAYATLDGTWTALTVSGTAVTLQGPVGEGAATITGGTLTVGGVADAALPVKVLDVQTTNCETVVYNATTGFATWNYNGACAVIQI